MTRFLWTKLGFAYRSYEERVEFLKIDKISTRYYVKLLKIAFSMVHNPSKISNYWLYQITIANNERIGYKINHNRRRLNIQDNYFIDRPCFIYNSLPSSVRKVLDFRKFKKLSLTFLQSKQDI